MLKRPRALNRDDHVRNHTFIMDAQGSWSLALAYDVSFSEGSGGEVSIVVAGEGRKLAWRHFRKWRALPGSGQQGVMTSLPRWMAQLAQWLETGRDLDVPERLLTQIREKWRMQDSGNEPDHERTRPV